MEKEKERKRKERREGRGGRREERCINDLTPLNISHSILSILRASNKNNTQKNSFFNALLINTASVGFGCPYNFHQ